VKRSDTQAVSIDAPATVVFDFVSDPYNLPQWAPGFARSVRPDGDDWIVTTDAGDRGVRIRVSRELGTVDFLAAGTPPGVEVGGYSRVIQNGEGSEYLFTLLYAEDLPEADVAAQRAIIAEELAAVRARCEAGPAVG
jgi:hypothetical protein